jgi:conjugal transfer ATP-binding protein TraC
MGQYLEFDEAQRINGERISVNVFSELTLETFMLDAGETGEDHSQLRADTERRKERSSLLTLFTQLLAVMANPRETISDLGQALLSNAIIEAYSRLRPGAIMKVDNFVAVLEEWQAENDKRGKQDHLSGQIAMRLRRYCRDGEYGHWFRSTMNVDFDKPFVVLELENLNATKDLREVILLLLISIIERKFYHGDRNIRKIILFDEAWDLFRNPNTALFIETAYRRMRKYNGSIGTIVQGYLDFANKGNAEVGNAILSNSAWKLIL